MGLASYLKEFRVSYLWAAPEIALKKKMKKNQYHPFTEVGERVVYEPYLFYLYVNGVLFFLSTSSGCIYWYAIQGFGNDVFDTTFILLTFWSLSQIAHYWQERRLEIEKDGQNYFFYVGDKLRYKGEIHQIYVRLKGVKSSNGLYYFTIVINGYRMEELQLITLSTNKEELEDLAKKIAFRLNINYFDWEDISSKHFIRHRDMTKEMKILHRTVTPPSKLLRRRSTLAKKTIDAFY